jgi:hypothetical protein
MASGMIGVAVIGGPFRGPFLPAKSVILRVNTGADARFSLP